MEQQTAGGIDRAVRAHAVRRRLYWAASIWGALCIPLLAYTGWKTYDVYATRRSIECLLDTLDATDSFTVTVKFYDYVTQHLSARRTEISSPEKVRRFASFFDGKRPVFDFDFDDIQIQDNPQADGFTIQQLIVVARRGSSRAQLHGGSTNVLFTTGPTTGFQLEGYSPLELFRWLQNEGDWVEVELESMHKKQRQVSGD